jgi:phenylacetate-CoA ligase
MKGLKKLFNKYLILDIKKPLENQIKKLNKFQPEVLSGYFSSLKLLAEQQENKKLNIYPKIILNAAEGVNQKDKKYIEKIFKSQLINLYGTAECCFLGIGKKEFGGIALFEDFALIEIKKDYILLTNFFNKTQPIIRYKIDDYLKINKNVDNKLPFTVVEEIIGRDELVIWFKNNKGKMDFIHPIVFVEFYVKDLEKFQIIIKDEKSFDFLAVIKEKNKTEVVKKIREKIDNILLLKNFSNVKYSIQQVDNILIDDSGKFKLIIKK